MKGGYQIIDLTGLDITVKDSQTSITDQKILNQLDGIKSYIEDGYNYSKPLSNQLKPILLRFRDKKNGEKQEASVWANLSKKTDNLTFVIEAVVNSTNLSTIQIEIVFELKQDEVDNYYYGIKIAKYLMKSNIVDIVNDAIEDEEIEIPAGGTKLYKHLIGSRGDSSEITLVSTYSNPLYVISFNGNIGISTSESSGSDLLGFIYLISFYLRGSFTAGYIAKYGALYKLYKYDGTLIDIITGGTDTITEL